MKGDITKVERLEIAILLEKGYSKRAIAQVLGRSPNTISYEVRKNSVDGSYNPHKADTKARVRKKGRRFQYSKIEKYPELKAIIIDEARRTLESPGNRWLDKPAPPRLDRLHRDHLYLAPD